MRKNSKEKGITLIALVITIIVLIILAGVSMNTLVGQNGIINKAQESGKVTQVSQEKEMIELAVINAKLGEKGYQETSRQAFQEYFDNSLGKDTVTVEDNQDTTFLVQFIKSGRNYLVKEDGSILSMDEKYRIASVEDLKKFRDEVNSGNTFEGKYVILENDITLDKTQQWEPIGSYPNDSPTPDAPQNKPFKGIFDGQGHKVDGVYIHTTEKVKGLFGIVESGVIKNVGVGENSNITGGVGTAGLVGYTYKGTLVSNCYNQATVTATGYNSGGIVGVCYLNNKIIKCNNSGVIQGTSRCGGIIGYNKENNEIRQCFNVGEVNANGNWIGGIIGLNIDESIVEQCYNVAKIQVTGDDIGGVVGKNDNAILKDSYNIGQVKSTGKYIGGVIGHLQGGRIVNCYNIRNGYRKSSDRDRWCLRKN